MILRALSIFLMLLLLTSTVVSADVTIDTRTNSERAAAGLTTLATSATLESIAQQRAVEVASQWPKWDLSLHDPWIYSAMGCIDWGGENLAFAYDWIDFVTAWMQSPSHRANLLYPNYDQQGSATYVDPTTGIIFAVQIFADTCNTGVSGNPTDPSTPAPQGSGTSQGAIERVPQSGGETGTETPQLPDTALPQGG